MDETLVRQAFDNARDLAVAEAATDELRTRIDDEVSQCFRDHATHIAASLACRFGYPEEAQEVVQDAFLRLHQALLDGQNVQAPLRWVGVVAWNLMRDRLKAARFRPLISSLGPRQHARAMNRPAVSPAPDDMMSRRQRVAALRQALLTLTPIERRCLHARVRGLKLRDIADHMDMARTSVHRAISRAISKLRTQIGE